MVSLKKIIILSIIPFIQVSCKDDNVPDIDETPLLQEQILGGWGIHSTYPYVNVSSGYKPAVETLGLYGKLENTLDSKAENVSFYFKKDKVYFFRDDILQDSSAYTLSDYIVHLEENPYLIGFYAPYYYMKFENNLLVMYLRKKETIELLEKDKSINSYISLIRKVVKDAQCELRFQRNELPAYQELN